jgi:hypothetical protein
VRTTQEDADKVHVLKSLEAPWVIFVFPLSICHFFESCCHEPIFEIFLDRLVGDRRIGICVERSGRLARSGCPSFCRELSQAR